VANDINSRLALTNQAEDGGRAQAGEAIRAARAGRIPTEQMLRSVLATQVIIPLADPPVMDGARMLSWKPATVSRDADGEQFVVVFTDEALDQQYARWRPEYGYRLRAGADWLIKVLPAGHGVIFNLGGGEIMFEWPASGITAWRADHAT
jgi:SseB protein N-terminal domain